MKAKTLETLEEGMVVKGIIKNITEYGAFVDLGGIDGLLHITDMSWGRVNHPSEVFKVGDEVTVKVLKYNAETERVSLGLKQTQEDPWNHAEEAYPPGKKVRGKVMSITDYGAFVELEPGVEGLIHVSEMSWTKKVKHPSKLLEVGQEIECQVLEVDAQGQAHLPRSQAARARSLDALHREVPPGRQDRRQGPLAHRLRRVRRHRRGRRRHGPQERPLVDGQGQQPGRPLPQGRRRRSHHPLDQPRREEGLASASSSSSTIRGRTLIDEYPPGHGRREAPGARASSTTASFVRIATASKASSRATRCPAGGQAVASATRCKAEISNVDTHGSPHHPDACATRARAREAEHVSGR